MQAYSDVDREDDPHALPDIEVFEEPFARQCSGCSMLDLNGDATECDCWDFEQHEWEPMAGWFWWSCFPGCLPDSEPFGPFETEEEALADARDGVE